MEGTGMCAHTYMDTPVALYTIMCASACIHESTCVNMYLYVSMYLCVYRSETVNMCVHLCGHVYMHA